MAKKLEVKTPAKMGRPKAEFKSEFCEQLIAHMVEGYSFEAFGANCHVGKDTLYKWLEEHEEFLDARKIGESYCRKTWEKIGKDGASGFIENFNAASWIFNMKNRFKWTDKVEVENTGANTVNINYSLIDSGS